MSDVEVFYAALNNASVSLSNATNEVLTETVNLYGDDVGVENPTHRAGLRLEMHRRLTALRDAAYARMREGDDLAAAITTIANKYSGLDVELTGKDQQ